jgi:hypothetical protein
VVRPRAPSTVFSPFVDCAGMQGLSDAVTQEYYAVEELPPTAL